jgi:hypothetical protein
MGRWERWDARNQARTERDNARFGGDDWAERLNRDTPGPAWAWAMGAVPFLHWVGDVAIAVDAWRGRRQKESG